MLDYFKRQLQPELIIRHAQVLILLHPKSGQGFPGIKYLANCMGCGLKRNMTLKVQQANGSSVHQTVISGPALSFEGGDSRLRGRFRNGIHIHGRGNRIACLLSLRQIGGNGDGTLRLTDPNGSRTP